LEDIKTKKMPREPTTKPQKIQYNLFSFGNRCRSGCHPLHWAWGNRCRRAWYIGWILYRKLRQMTGKPKYGDKPLTNAERQRLYSERHPERVQASRLRNAQKRAEQGQVPQRITTCSACPLHAHCQAEKARTLKYSADNDPDMARRMKPLPCDP